MKKLASGKTIAVTAKIVWLPKQKLGNWVTAGQHRLLTGTGDKVVSAEQLELARLRAVNARLKMERDIIKWLRRTSRGRCCEVRLD